MRGSATLPDSRVLLGMKPQHTVAKTIASKRGVNSLSKGQFMKTDLDESIVKLPLPKISRFSIIKLASIIPLKIHREKLI